MRAMHRKNGLSPMYFNRTNRFKVDRNNVGANVYNLEVTENSIDKARLNSMITDVLRVFVTFS